MVSVNRALSTRTVIQQIPNVLRKLIWHEPGDILIHDFCLVIYSFDGEEDLPE